MDSKLLQGELNYDNGSNYYTEIPSYRMQTISSRLKIVEKEDELRKERFNAIIPFTVGSAFITHNVKLLKQETLQKLKTIFLSYKNENEINSSNINELRLLKNDIDCFRIESNKLKFFASRRKQFLKAVASRYKYCNGRKDQLRFRDRWLPTPIGNRRKEKLNALRDEGDNKKELVDLLKLHNRLETLFRKNKSNTSLSMYKNETQKRRTNQEGERSVEDVENLPKQRTHNDENMYAISRESSIVSINKPTHSSNRSTKPKRKPMISERRLQDSQKERLDYDDESMSKPMDQRERLRLLGELNPMELSAQLADIRDLGQKHFAPSIYSRKKRRKHVRKYIPSEVAVEDIQEQIDDNIEDVTQFTGSRNSAADSDGSQSNRSATNKQTKWKTANAEMRPQTQPIN